MRIRRSLETFRVSVDGRTLAIIGNDGRIVLVSNESKRMICSLKMNGSARCAAFSHDNHYLYSSGGNGQVYKWDLRTQRCLQRHVDEGSTGTLALDVTSDGSKYATGESQFLYHPLSFSYRNRTAVRCGKYIRRQRCGRGETP